MDKKVITINGSCLYTPSGAAREYAAVGCNFYRGCPYQCRYCYNRKGLTAAVMGVDHAVLENKFTSMKTRPKKWRNLPSEDYALLRYELELHKYMDYLKEVGIFFSFSTDPMCSDAIALTWRAVCYAISFDVPVKILTKNAEYTALNMLSFDLIPEEKRRLIAFGFTLTGRDDWEPYASPNLERYRMMKVFKEMGFRTFASIEPIVDFGSSLEMIMKSVGFCDQYLIGLMSKRGKDLSPYSKEECAGFIRDVDSIVCDVRIPVVSRPRVYWKESVRKFVADDGQSMNLINSSPGSVSSKWSLFTQSEFSCSSVAAFVFCMFIIVYHFFLLQNY